MGKNSLHRVIIYCPFKNASMKGNVIFRDHFCSVVQIFMCGNMKL